MSGAKLYRVGPLNSLTYLGFPGCISQTSGRSFPRSLLECRTSISTGTDRSGRVSTSLLYGRFTGNPNLYCFSDHWNLLAKDTSSPQPLTHPPLLSLPPHTCREILREKKKFRRYDDRLSPLIPLVPYFPPNPHPMPSTSPHTHKSYLPEFVQVHYSPLLFVLIPLLLLLVPRVLTPHTHTTPTVTPTTFRTLTPTGTSPFQVDTMSLPFLVCFRYFPKEGLPE